MFLVYLRLGTLTGNGEPAEDCSSRHSTSAPEDWNSWDHLRSHRSTVHKPSRNSPQDLGLSPMDTTLTAPQLFLWRIHFQVPSLFFSSCIVNSLQVLYGKVCTWKLDYCIPICLYLSVVIYSESALFVPDVGGPTWEEEKLLREKKVALPLEKLVQDSFHKMEERPVRQRTSTSLINFCRSKFPWTV